MYDMKELYEAFSVQEAIELRLAHPEAQIIAGGSDVLVQMREGKRAGKELISIYLIDELRGVSLDADGSILSQQSVDVGEAIEEPFEPEREGYTFTGWKHGGSSFNAEKPLKSDTTLTATWAEGDNVVAPESTGADTRKGAERTTAGSAGMIGAVAAAVIVILLVWRIAARRKSS